MSAGRRGLLLSVTFLGLVAGITRDARAQPQPITSPPDPQVGRHDLWQQNLSPDQIRDKLGKFGIGSSDALSPLERMLLDALKEKYPNSDPKQREAIAKKILADK